MAEKDLIEKRLEDYNDVFADIYNTLVFEEHYLREEKLNAGPTTSIYKNERGETTEQFRDVLKQYGNSCLSLMSLGIENQTKVDKAMPIRVMGYDYGNYRGMINNGKEVTPVTTIVLNFGDKQWNEAKSLHEMMRLPEKMKKYVEDYKIRVYDIAFLSDNIIEKFTSDFKLVARFFKDRRLGVDTLRTNQAARVRHIEAVLDFLSVFTKDERYRNSYTERVKEMEENGEEIDMCWIIQGWINEGIEEGKIEGKIELLTKFVRNGMLSVSEAAKEVGMDMAAFESEMEKCR